MGKLLLAFAAGVALTSFAFALLDGEQDQQLVSPSVAPAGRATAPFVETIVAADEALGAPASVAASEGTVFPESLARCTRGDWAQVAAPDFLSACTDEELESFATRAGEIVESMNEMERVMSFVQSELIRRGNIARWAAAPPPDVPINLPPEFNYLSEYPLSRHEVLQREAIDANWSPQMQAQLQSFFTSRPEITSKFGYPTINCRTSGCEIAFASYTLDPAQRLLLEGFEFPDAVRGVYEQPWATQLMRTTDELNRVNVESHPRFQDDGPQTFLWFVWRVGADFSEFAPR